MELLRIPALTVYALRLCFAKSQAERIHVKRVSWVLNARLVLLSGTNNLCPALRQTNLIVLVFLSAESGLWVPVWPWVRLDHVYLCSQCDLQHHMSHHYALWWATYSDLFSSAPSSFFSLFVFLHPCHHLNSWSCMWMCCCSSHRGLTLLCCLPVQCWLCEFAAVVSDTQTQWVASQTPTPLLSLPKAQIDSIYFWSQILIWTGHFMHNALLFCSPCSHLQII